MRMNKCFLLSLLNCFSMYLDSDKKILPLCYKHIIAMSSCKIKEKYHLLVFSQVCLKHVQVICWRSCLKFVLSWLPYFADSCSK